MVQNALCIVGGDDMTGDVESARAATVGTRVNSERVKRQTPSASESMLEIVREIYGEFHIF